MKTSNFFVQMFGKEVNPERIFLRCLPESELRQNLVGEREGHYERRVTGGTSKVHKTTLSQQDNMSAIREFESINLGLDVHFLNSIFFNQATSISTSKCPMLQQMASSRITEKCRPKMMSLQPVVLTKM